MSQDVYIRLRGFLDKLPSGYPATDSGVGSNAEAVYAG
jgi:hypothetical protein